jgi:CRISPR-associated endonuclease/helicase Cas3
MVPVFLQCESHPGRPLADHLSDVASRAAGSLLRAAALCHDAGKATRHFQEYLGGSPPKDDRLRQHSLLGAEILLEVLSEKLQSGWEQLTADQVLLACLFVRRHHGALDDLADALSCTSEQKRLLAQQKEVLDETGVQEWLAAQGYGLRRCGDKDRVALRVKAQRGLLAERDVATCVGRFQRAIRDFGRLIEADRDSAAGFAAGFFESGSTCSVNRVEAYRDSLPGGADAIGRVRGGLFDSAIGAALKRPADCGGLWTLTSPTGSGKTLAALGWALQRREARVAAGRPTCPVIYALPFTSIIDQNAAVFRDIFGEEKPDESVLSVHHHLAEPGTWMERGEESLARNWTEGWRADVVCTTFVQVVGALFHATGWDARRMSHLAGGILILDEVQGVPARLWPVIRESLASLSREFATDVLLMTATQPAMFGDGETVEVVTERIAGDDVFDRFDVIAETGASMELVDLLRLVKEEVVAGNARNCLVVLNTIREALDLFALIERAGWASGYRRYHLSTNLRPRDRGRILEQIAKSTEGTLVVSTQVVEAGLDLSFDVVIRALAPLDSMVQAAGRCNRHGVGPRGRVRVVTLAGNSGTLVYGKTHMDVAMTLCRDIAGSAISEPEMRRQVSRYFQELKQRVSQDQARDVLDAVRMMEFASLRGEGQGKDSQKKRVILIEDQRDRTAHFVETDESDRMTWERFREALGRTELGERRQAIRALRNEVGQRIVEVPQRWSLEREPDSRTGLVHVEATEAESLYSSVTGWRRRA